MSSLTETEYRLLRTRTLAILGELGAADNATATAIAAHLVPTVQEFIGDALAAERARLVRAIEECDPSDDYHRTDPTPPNYYTGLDRAIRFIKGDISTWTDPRP